MRSAALALLSLSCCDLGVQLSAPYPDLGEAKSIVLAIRGGDTLQVEAHDRDQAAIRLLTGESGVIELLAYNQPLDALGLAPGRLVPVPGGERLPAPALIYEASVEDDTLSAWQTKLEMSSELASFTVPSRPSQCARFELIAQAVVPFAYTSITAGENAYVGGPSGLSRLSLSGSEKVALDPDLIVRGVALEPSGAALIGAEGGEIWRGDLSQVSPRLQHVFTTTSGDNMSWIVAEETEVMTMSGFGVVERFDGTESRVIYRFPRDHTLGAGLVRAGPGEAVAVHQLWGAAVRFRNGSIIEEPISSAEALYFNAIHQVAGMGTVIASDQGRFFVSNGESWTDLGNSQFSLRVLSILPTEDGFLWGGEFGHLGEYRRDGGFCAPEAFHPHDVWHLLEVGGLIYLVNRGDEGSANMTVLRRI